jgi:hypothetical protein
MIWTILRRSRNARMPSRSVDTRSCIRTPGRGGQFGLVLLVAVLLGVGRASLAQDASPAKTAERSSAALEIVVRDVKPLFMSVANAPWAQRIASSALYRRWIGSPAFQAARATIGKIEEAFGQPLPKVLGELLAGGVSMTVDPTEGEGADVVVVGLAENRQIVEQTISLWNRLDNVTSQPVAGPPSEPVVYERRKPGEEPVFYATTGRLWLVGNRLGAVQSRLQAGVAGLERALASESESPPLVSVRMRTAAWNQTFRLEEGLAAADPFQRWFAQQWSALRELTGEIDLRTGPAVRITAKWDAGKTSARWQDWVRLVTGSRAEVFDRAPAGTLVAIGGRIQPGLALQLLPAPEDEAERRELQKLRKVLTGVCLGLDFVDDILSKVSVDWGLYVLPRPATETDLLPVGIVFAWKMPPAAPGDPRGGQVGRALTNALQAGLSVWATVENDRPDRGQVAVRLTTDVQGPESDELLHLEGLDWGQPAFSLTDGYLVIASHPGLVREFASPSQASARLAARLERLWPTEPGVTLDQQVLAHIGVGSIRTWLAANQSDIARAIAKARGTEAEKVERGLERLSESLELCDDLLLGLQFAPESVSTEFRWVTAPQ